MFVLFLISIWLFVWFRLRIFLCRCFIIGLDLISFFMIVVLLDNLCCSVCVLSIKWWVFVVFFVNLVIWFGLNGFFRKLNVLRCIVLIVIGILLCFVIMIIGKLLFMFLIFFRNCMLFMLGILILLMMIFG